MSIEKRIGKYIKLNISSLSSSPPRNGKETKGNHTHISHINHSSHVDVNQTCINNSNNTYPLSNNEISETSTPINKTEVDMEEEEEEEFAMPLPDLVLNESKKDKEKEFIKELYLKKERTILKALQMFNESNIDCNKKIFVKRIPDYNKANCQNERELYAAIDRIITKSFLKQQYISVTETLATPYSMHDGLEGYNAKANTKNNTKAFANHNTNTGANTNVNKGTTLSTHNRQLLSNAISNSLANNKNSSYMNVDKLIFKLKVQNKSLEFIAIKGIIISLINVINERIGKLFLLNFSGDTPDIDCGIFHEIYNEFLILSNICPLLEQDFSQSLTCFKEKYEMNFSLCELFSDLFWDYIFKIKQINCLFVEFFTSEDEHDLTRIVMREVIKVLWLIEMPLKKNIAEILEISAITNEKVFFATYIIEYKTQLLYPNKIIQFHVNINNDHDQELGVEHGIDYDSHIENGYENYDIDNDTIISNKKESNKEPDNVTVTEKDKGTNELNTITPINNSSSIDVNPSITDDDIELENFEKGGLFTKSQLKALIKDDILYEQELQQIEQLKQLQLLQQQLQEQQSQLKQEKEIQKKLKLDHYHQQLLQQKQSRINNEAKGGLSSSSQQPQTIPWDLPQPLPQPLCLPQMATDLPLERLQQETITTTTCSSNTNKKKKNNKNQIKVQQSKETEVQQSIDEQYKSIDELYNYIVSDHSASKKKNKKKKRNTITNANTNTNTNTNLNTHDDNNNNNTQATSNSNNNHNSQENIIRNSADSNRGNNNANDNGISMSNNHNESDSVVEQFKLHLYSENPKASDVQKIKPNISSEWLKSIIIN